MDHKLTVTVPEEVYQPLLEEALKRGRMPEEEAFFETSTLGAAPQRRAKAGALRELFGSVDLGHPMGIDNESIDADLAREYADTHS